MSHLMTCPDCGLSLVPYGGEDVCTEMCERCERHDCVCDEDDGATEHDDDE